MFGIAKSVKSRVCECTPELFRKAIDDPLTGRVCAEIADALEMVKRGEMTRDEFETKKTELKKQLPVLTPHATYTDGCRTNKSAVPSGLSIYDIDHIDDPRGYYQHMVADRLSELGIVMAHVTPSNEGLRLLFVVPAGMSLAEAQKWMSKQLNDTNYDGSVKDLARCSFLVPRDYILYLDEEEMWNPSPIPSALPEGRECIPSQEEKQDADETSSSPRGGNEEGASLPLYHGVEYSKIVDAWLGDKKVEKGDRHRTSLILADHLRYITDNDAQLIERIMRQVPFVQEIIKERNEPVAQTIKDAQGYKMFRNIPKRMQTAIDKVANANKTVESAESMPVENGFYKTLPMGEWAEELKRMAKVFPCMKELFLNVHPFKLPAVLFSSAAMLGTLMTRTWYRFWYEPTQERRLNYCIFIIGDPGSGKNVIEKYYKLLLEPMTEADQAGIEAVNHYKEGRTERTTSTKAQKGDALKKPNVPIRVHPARTSTGEFIRHMLATKENIQGRMMNLHMFSFDSELDNVTKNNKGGDWKDREVMELKAFHNEEDGQMYANMESVTGKFNIYWNFIYTGTPYALHRKVNQRNFGTGMSTRLAVIPMPDIGIAERRQKVDLKAEEKLREWAYRLDKVEGELPIEALNDETYEWQSSHLEVAEFNDDKADRMILKRIPYYGIGVALPFIVMRHWKEWNNKHTLTIDEQDRKLCRLVMEIQYKCQHLFFGEMAHNYFEEKDKGFVARRRTSRYQECYRKLPDEFKPQHFVECFACSASTASRSIIRLVKDNVIKRVRYGLYKKIFSELP